MLHFPLTPDRQTLLENVPAPSRHVSAAKWQSGSILIPYPLALLHVTLATDKAEK
jgi:hypothetical protein